jgi:NRPS condensation-like uncharacterized protein
VEPERPSGDEPATLQSRLEDANDDSEGGAAQPVGSQTIADPVALLRHLDVSGRFHRDSRFGRVFHRGMVSLRENVPTDSLHVSIDGNHLSAHVDGVSPLAEEPGRSRYSVRRALMHNLAGMAHDVVLLLRGREGDHRCRLDCEWVSDETCSVSERPRLLDPSASSWSVQLEARVDGRIDEARLNAAVKAVLGPPSRERDPLEVIDCDDDDGLDRARASLLRKAIAYDDKPPLHVYLARNAGGDVLMLNLNHAAGDSFGVLHVLRRLAAAYSGDPGEPLHFMAARDLPVRPAAAPASATEPLYKRVVERLRDAHGRPALIAADQPTDEPGYGFHLLALPADETRHVVDAEHAHGRRNVLMSALHLAIADWNRSHGAPRRLVGVLMPADLRPDEWPQDTIGNFSVTTRVTTSRHERGSPARVLEAVGLQTARNKASRTGVALIAGLQRNGLLALWAKQSLVVLAPVTTNHRVDAAMLGNLGHVDDAACFGPDAGRVVELWHSTPPRSPLTLSVGAVTVAGRLHLTFRYPHRMFSADAARRFAECYRHHVRGVTGLEPAGRRE